MKSFATENIRNLAVIGHGDAGKTQLVSSLLHVAGTSHRWGKVDEGTTITDYEEDSIARKVSLNNNFAHTEYKDTKINLIDTPGYAAFVSHARPALRVADCALVVVDGVHGIEVQTEKTWQYANEFLLPRFMVINKIDKEHADFGHALETATSSFARSIVPFTLPIGAEGDFKGVVDVVHQKAYEFDADGKAKEIPMPEAGRDVFERTRERLDRDRRRVGRRSDGEVFRERHAARGRDLSESRQGDRREQALPRVRGVGDDAGRSADLARSHRRIRAESGDARGRVWFRRQRHDGRPHLAKVFERRTVLGLRFPHDRRSVRRPHQRLEGHLAARSRPTRPFTIRHARRWSGSAHCTCISGKTLDKVNDGSDRRHHRRRQTQGHADRRHALRQGEADRLSAGRISGSRDRLRHRAEVTCRRRKDLGRSAQDPRRRPVAAF